MEKRVMIGVVISVLVIMLLAGSFFIFSGDEELSKIRLSDLQLTNYVDENYEFIEKLENTYIKGDLVYIYYDIYGFESEITDKGLTYWMIKDIELSKDGQIIEDFTYSEEKFGTELALIRSYQIIPTEDLELGEYTVKITSKDVISTNTDTKTAAFVIQ